MVYVIICNNFESKPTYFTDLNYYKSFAGNKRKEIAKDLYLYQNK